MFKRLFFKYMDEAGAEGSTGGSVPAAAPAAAASTASAAPVTAAPAPDAGLESPGSLLNGKPAEAAADPAAAKPADGKTTADPAKPEDGAKQIEYTDFKLPDGVTVDSAKITEFKTIAAELGIPQEGAQKILDMYSAELKQANEAPLRAWNALQTEWRDAVKNDPEIGGANLDKNLGNIKAGLTAVMGDAAQKFFEALSVTGAGNNPDVIRGLMKAAAPHSPATSVNGSPGSSGKTAGSTLYPTMAGLGNGHT